MAFFSISTDRQALSDRYRQSILMGIRGLTGFIDDHFTGWKRTRITGNLIIDGYSVCHTLYHDLGIDSTHGGDYVTFALCIKEFFRALMNSNVTPYVVFDGVDLDEKKKETHFERRTKDVTRVWKMLHNQSLTERFLPYFARQVMVETVQNIDGVHIKVVEGDADSYLAGMAIALNGPVLSTDSDFFIFPIPSGYIPYTNLTWKNWKEHPIVANVFTYTTFIKQMGLTDPALLTLIPAVMGNDTMVPLEDFTVKVLMKGSPCNLKLTQATVKSIIQFAKKFNSSIECTMSMYESTKCSNESPLLNMQEAYDFYYASVQQYSTLDENPKLRCKDQCSIPDFVVKQFVKGKFSALLMDAVCLRDIDLRVAAEDMTNRWCHHIGVPIRRVIYAITCGKDGKVFEYQRCLGNFKDYKHVSMELISQIRYKNEIVHVPQLIDIPSFSMTKKMYILFGVLECIEDMFAIIPSDLRLVLAITRYWRIQCETDLNMCYLLPVLIIHLMEDLPKKLTQTTNELESFSHREWTIDNTTSKEITCGYLLQFVHAFAQWQSLYHDIYCLNQLLLEPVKLLGISEFFESTKMYSCFQNILKYGVERVLILKEIDHTQYDSMFKTLVS